MTYAPPVDREHITWLMGQVEARCSRPAAANVGRVKGQFDLELVICVERADRGAIGREFCADMTKAMRERTGLSPVIYLDGDEPELLTEDLL